MEYWSDGLMEWSCSNLRLDRTSCPLCLCGEISVLESGVSNA
jgi:hypothetical protein